jgi:hypothetical protein
MARHLLTQTGERDLDREQLIISMAAALKSLSNEMLNSGTARWGAYERAGLINFNDRTRSDPRRINANTEGIIFSPLDYAAVAIAEREREGAALPGAGSGASGASGAISS